MTAVNPPPIRIPDKILNDPELRDFFQEQNFMIFQLWKRTGGGEDIFNTFSEVTTSQMLALIDDIRNQIGSGDPLTWDDTGFTWDDTHLTFDRTEA